VKGLIREPGERNVRGDSSILTKPDVSLCDLATTRTVSLLCRHDVDIDNTFLALPPEQWPTSESYLSGQARLKQLRVVNDTAERDVKLFEDFNQLLTNDEEEKQLMLQVVASHRKTVPTHKKTKKSVIRALQLSD